MGLIEVPLTKILKNSYIPEKEIRMAVFPNPEGMKLR